MIERLSRIVAAVLALVMVALFLITPPALVSDSGEETAMLPPCDVDEGLPFIDDDEVTCYWGMSEDVVELIKSRSIYPENILAHLFGEFVRQ